MWPFPISVKFFDKLRPLVWDRSIIGTFFFTYIKNAEKTANTSWRFAKPFDPARWGV
jgi:hypothetical protein